MSVQLHGLLNVLGGSGSIAISLAGFMITRVFTALAVDECC